MEEVALRQITPKFFEHDLLLPGLNPLSADFEPQSVSHGNNRPNNRGVLRVSDHIFYEALPARVKL